VFHATSRVKRARARARLKSRPVRFNAGDVPGMERGSVFPPFPPEKRVTQLAQSSARLGNFTTARLRGKVSAAPREKAV